MDTLGKICKYVEEGQIEEAKEATRKALEVEKIPPMEILNKGLIAGLAIIGEKFGRQEAFVPSPGWRSSERSSDARRPLSLNSSPPGWP
ncbi:MAG: binding domain [Deltaproteobacteria bacterium]|nr:binding domain [Deltaproteobacteria bacterium]